MTQQSPFNEQGYIAAGLRGAAGEEQLRDVPAGLYISRRSLPPGVVVIEDFLSAGRRHKLVAYAAGQPGRPSTVQAAGAAAGAAETRLSADRVTDYIEIDGVASEVHGVLRDVFVRQLGPHYGKTIEWYEKPELLRYRSGGHYSPHADSENWDPQTRTWVRAMDRDYSMLLYLNDDFEGGSLSFPNFGLRLQPAAGMLVAFPADHRYVHCAEPTEAGQRLVLVCWCAAQGSSRVGNAPPPGATLLSE